MESTRQTQRRRRRRGARRTVSLVGYTNTGKSTLLNALTDADVLVENRLFATLDPRTRRLALPGGETVLCSDTVGFVRKLPHQLVTAFHSTLETVADSDLLVHVVDASAADPDGQIDAVRAVLAEIGAQSVPEILAFNKCDRAVTAAGQAAPAAPRFGRLLGGDGGGSRSGVAGGGRHAAGQRPHGRAHRPLRPGRCRRRPAPQRRGPRGSPTPVRGSRCGSGSTRPARLRFAQFATGSPALLDPDGAEGADEA